jgi:hypothetical protein
MVGKVKVDLNRKKSFAEIMVKFIGKPFKHGGFGPDGYDCIGLDYAYLVEAGKAANLVINLGEWRLDNYHELDRRTDHTEAHQKLLEIFMANGREVPVGEQVAGDPVIIKDKSGDLYPAIYTGNGNFMTAFKNTGVQTKKLEKDTFEIIMARRI